MSHLRRWPVHPQWLISIGEERADLAAALGRLHGKVADIGCADRRLASLLPSSCEYIGVDYPDTAVHLYGTRPDIFADACSLPFADGSLDGVILKDVLEHVRGADRALAEIGRVLRSGGQLILWMPFMYPVHDAPQDFQRFTEHGLRAYLGQHGLVAGAIKPVLSPFETAGLLFCLALADAGERIVSVKRIYLPILPLLGLLLVSTNLVAKALSWLPCTRFMPAFYRLTAIRASNGEAS
jgi:SAM-dependent methyltransferase